MRSELEKRLDEEFPYAKDAQKKPRFPREKNTCLRQANDISRLFRSIMHRRESSEKLNESYRPLLRHLSHADGCSQLDLVRATGLRAPTVSITISKMESDGLVTRVADDYDLRSRRVYITDKGRAINASTRGAIKELESVAMRNISEEDIAVTLRTLEKISDNIRENYDDKR